MIMTIMIVAMIMTVAMEGKYDMENVLQCSATWLDHHMLPYDTFLKPQSSPLSTLRPTFSLSTSPLPSLCTFGHGWDPWLNIQFSINFPSSLPGACLELPPSPTMDFGQILSASLSPGTPHTLIIPFSLSLISSNSTKDKRKCHLGLGEGCQ